MTNQVSKSMLITDMRKVFKASSTSRSSYRAMGSYASETAERKFGSWSLAVKAAKRGK